jgi:hypothetical protein
VIVRGLQRARPGSKVTPKQEAPAVTGGIPQQPLAKAE